MDVKAFPALIVGVVVALVLAGAVLPAFAEVTASEDTLTNKGLFYIEDTAEELNYVYENKVLSLNGEVITIPSDVAEGTTVLYTESLIIRAYSNDMRFRGTYDYNATSFNITVSNGTITGTVYTTTDHTVNTTYTDFYGITNEDTGVVMTKIDTKPYVKTDTALSSAPLIHPTEIGNSNTYMIVYMTGSIDDGLTFSLLDIHYGTVMSGYTVSDYQITTTEVNGYNDLYQIQEIKFTISTVPDDDSDPVSTDRTFSYVALDEKQTAERTVHTNGPLTVLINVLPLLAIAGLVTGAVVWFVVRKR